MDGHGRYVDNIFRERVCCDVKCEEIYLADYETLREARAGLAAYLRSYNQERLRLALRYSTPTST